jgi:hypothetical protein
MGRVIPAMSLDLPAHDPVLATLGELVQAVVAVLLAWLVMTLIAIIAALIGMNRDD